MNATLETFQFKDLADDVKSKISDFTFIDQ